MVEEQRGRSSMSRLGTIVGLVGIALAVMAQGACSSSSTGSGSSATMSGEGGTSGEGGMTYTASPSTTDCTATVTQGPMGGKAVGGTCEYLGIPFGQPPVGPLRFMPPVAAGPFAKVPLDATSFGAACLQSGSTLLSGGTTATSEDCLFVNVYTPKAAPTQPLPVMVFIYGGAFNIGTSNQYDGQALSEQGPVVLVTLNYRLGAFGFLALPELDATRPGAPSGSDGIRDQQLALKWVQDNIATFHGDPTNVTVFGESAGSLSTCIHIVSPGSQGLAKRYIMESVACVGSGEQIYSQSQAYQVGEAFASSLCSSGDGGAGDGGSPGAVGTDAGAEVLSCLRGKTPAEITGWLPASGTVPSNPVNALLGNLLGPPFTPTVEGTGGVLPDTPANLIAAGKFDTSASVMAGTNLDEFGLFVYLATNPVLGGSSSSQINIMTAAQLDQGLQTAFGSGAAAVEEQYQPITDANASGVLVDIVTDYAFRCPTRLLAQMLQAKGVSDYYLYSYEIGKAWHSFELVPLFGEQELVVLGATTPSSAYTQTMLGYWTQFAAKGNPNSASGDGGAPTWPTNVFTGSDQYMQLVDPTPDPMAHLAQSNCEFWASTAAPATL